MIGFYFRFQSKISINYRRDLRQPVNNNMIKKPNKVSNVYRKLILFVYTWICYDVDTIIHILEQYFPNRVITRYYLYIIRNLLAENDHNNNIHKSI